MLPPHAPGPEAVPAELRERGRCAQLAAIRIFDDKSRYPEAKAICGTCPVAAQCLTYALANESNCVWGGLTPAERDVMRQTVLPFSPEDRRHAAELRDDLAKGRPQEQIARDHGCNVRTVLRWAAADRPAA